MNKQSKEMAKLAYQALSEKKAEDIRIIDISEININNIINEIEINNNIKVLSNQISLYGICSKCQEKK